MGADSTEGLSEIAKQIKQGIRPQPVTARTFIGWFGAERRSYWNVKYIHDRLKEHQLVTSPDFEYVFIDSPISFLPAPKEKSAQSTEGLALDERTDPTYRIGKLASANKQLVSVRPDDNISKAVTLMIAHDYSQLPVMTSDREVKGIISWSSLGTKLALGNKCDHVRECMIPAKEISSDRYIFDVIGDIIANQYVLIRNPEKVITGIVTTSDLSQQFRELAEPFLLLGEIEKHIRRMIFSKYTQDELMAVRDPSDQERDIGSIEELNLGEYMRLMQNPANWEKLGIPIDRESFVEKLDEIRRIRNDVMHFDPDPTTGEEVLKLRDFVRLLQTLAAAGAI